jgi:N utilization substance protein B
MSAAPMSPKLKAKRTARLAAVQALYQMELSGLTIEEAREEAHSGRLPAGEDGPLGADLDLDHFAALIDGAVAEQSAVDTLIAEHLAQGWRLERIDSVSRAILRAGVVEVWRFGETPLAVIISEYVEIARAFFDSAEPKFINATLDACGHAARGLGPIDGSG